MAQISTGLNDPNGSGAGVTTHYTVTYDDSLSAADGVDRANALLASCEADYNQMAAWFGNIATGASGTISVQIQPGPWASANWSSTNSVFTVNLLPGNGSKIDLVRYLLVSEMTEVFMSARRNGWGYSYGDTNEGVRGEGLSRYLGYLFLAENALDIGVLTNTDGSSFFVANYWMQEVNQITGAVDRMDYLGTDPDVNKPGVLTGCATLFLYYLSVQLGYHIENIINAGASTLKGVYTNLTGDKTDPFPAFSGLLNTAYPNGATITSGPNRDNPFPIYQQLQITCASKLHSPTEPIPVFGGINHWTGQPFSYTHKQVLAFIQQSTLGLQRNKDVTLYSFYVSVNGHTAGVGIFYHQVPGPHGLETTAYLATTPDRFADDNLANLPQC